MLRIALSKCRWVQGSQGVTHDKNGFVSVDLRNVGYKTELFVLAKDVLQVFYCLIQLGRHGILSFLSREGLLECIMRWMRSSLINLMKSLLLQLVRSNSGRGRGRGCGHGHGRKET